MTLDRPSPAPLDGLAVVAIAAAFMAAPPTGAASAAGVGNSPGGGAAASSGQAANGSGYEPSETDCVTIAEQPGRTRRTT